MTVERARYTSLGAIITLTAGMAGLSMFFALEWVLNGATVAPLVLAAFWAIFILNLDRWLISSSFPAGAWRRLLAAAPRVLLSVLFGIVIAEPLVLALFHDEVADVFASERIAATSTYAAQLSACNPQAQSLDFPPSAPPTAACKAYSLSIPSGLQAAILTRQNSIKEQRASIKAEAAAIDTLAALENIARSECNGNRGPGLSGIVGQGPNCERDRREADLYRQQGYGPATTRARTAIANVASAAAAVSQQVNEYNSARSKAILDATAQWRAAQQPPGLLDSIRALDVLQTNNPRVRVTVMLIRLLIVAIDSLPVIVKVLSRDSGYERVIKTDVEAAVARNKQVAQGELEIEVLRASYMTRMAQRQLNEAEAGSKATAGGDAGRTAVAVLAREGELVEEIDLTRPSHRGERVPVSPAHGDWPTTAPRGSGAEASATSPIRLRARAEMQSHVAIGAETRLGVYIAREEIAETSGLLSVAGLFSAPAGSPLVIEVIAKANMKVIGPSRKEFLPPPAGEPAFRPFRVAGVTQGAGVLLVTILRDELPILSMQVSPIVHAGGAEELISEHRLDAEAAVVVQNDSTEVDVVLKIIELRQGEQVTRRFDLTSRKHRLWKQYETKPVVGDLQAYLGSIFERIEGNWELSYGNPAAFLRKLKAYGGTLFDELIPPGLDRALWRLRDDLQGTVVVSDEPFIPWELIHLKDPDTGVLCKEDFFLGQLGVIRWVWGPWPSERLRVRSGRVRYVIPEYPDPAWELPAAERERQFVERRLGASAVAPSYDDVIDLLSSGDFDLLHFSGHGRADLANAAEASILLQGQIQVSDEGDKYVPEELRADEVSQYLARSSSVTGRVVFLNACRSGRQGFRITSQGGFASAFLGGQDVDRDVGLFVGSLWAVDDASAAVFAEEFYDQLLLGKTVAQAARSAREVARAAGDATWLAYTIYAHPAARLHLTS